MPKATRDNYAERLVEVDDDASQVEDVLGDLTALQGASDDEMKQAQLELIKVRTKTLSEKLEARKQELFSDWSERFFEVFSSSFGKFKNDLISLHLDEEQLAVLNEKLELALKSMEDGLIQINSEWMSDDDYQKQEDQ